jgi:hypothetical protein
MGAFYLLVIKIFNGFSIFSFYFLPYILRIHLFQTEKGRKKGTSKKLFNILFLFNRNSDSKEEKLVAGINLFL